MLKYLYKGVVMFSVSEYSDSKLREIMSEDAYDLYINSDNEFYLGDDGKLYEFRYLPDDEDDYLRVFENWKDFNKRYPEESYIPRFIRE